MFFFERRKFIDFIHLNVNSQSFASTIIFLLFFILFPIQVVITSIILITLYQYKLYKSTNEYKRTGYTPEPGDVLIFFNHLSYDIPDWIVWDSVMSLHTNIPIRHIATMIDDDHYIELKTADNSNYDNITKKNIGGKPRVGKIDYLYEDWAHGEVMVIKTNRKVDTDIKDKILNGCMKDGYWSNGGCLGHFNKVQKIIDESCPFFLSTEDIVKYYDNAKIGYVKN